MALIAIAADKGAPGVTTTSIALAAVWPRPVLLAECDPSGGDLVYRLPAADGARLDPRRGLLSLAVAARRGLAPHQVWEHAQKLHGGLDVLAGVGNAEQGMGVELFWGNVGRVLASVPQADVIADCGRIGVDGPVYDLLAQATSVVLLTRASLGEVIRLRDRVGAVTVALAKRGRAGLRIDVVVVADYKSFGSALAEVSDVLRQSGLPARVVGGLAQEPKSADQLRGEWSGKLDKSMFIRTARAIASDLVSALPEPASATGPQQAPGPPGSTSRGSGDPRAAGDPKPARGSERAPSPAAPGQPAHGSGPRPPAPAAPGYPAPAGPCRPYSAPTQQPLSTGSPGRDPAPQPYSRPAGQPRPTGPGSPPSDPASPGGSPGPRYSLRPDSPPSSALASGPQHILPSRRPSAPPPTGRDQRSPAGRDLPATGPREPLGQPTRGRHAGAHAAGPDPREQQRDQPGPGSPDPGQQATPPEPVPDSQHSQQRGR